MTTPAMIAELRHHLAGKHLSAHAHPHGQLSIVLAGTMTITAEEGWWLVPPGLAIWVPAEVEHGSYYAESSSLIHIRLDPALTASLPAHCHAITVSELLRELAREAVRLDATEAGGQASSPSTLNLLAQLMVLQAMRPAAGAGLFVPHGHDRRLRHVTMRLRHDPGNSLTIDALAREAHTSGRTLARLFVTETGMSFGRWRDHLRVVSAVDRLTQGESITRTALALGYSSASSFTSLFTRLLGVPPRRYLRQQQSSASLPSGISAGSDS